MPLMNGQVLNNRYRIETRLGQGSFGEVYKAQELQTPRRTVAIKFLRKNAPGIDAQLYNQCKERFELEATLAGLFDSPHLIRVFTSEIIEDDLHLVMEYAGGGSLADLIQNARKRQQPLPIRRVIEIGYQIALGLAALHEAEVIHRDLKPSNVLLTADGRVKIADLGFAQTDFSVMDRDQKGSLSTEHPGTPQYMPPEQRPPHKEALKPPADIYALGCMLFELLTLKTYYYLEPGVRLRDLRPDVPVWLERLVMQMLAEDPAQRPWNGKKAAAAIIPPPTISESSPGTGGEVKAPASHTEHHLRRIWPIVLALAGIGLLALLLWSIISYLFNPAPAPAVSRVTVQTEQTATPGVIATIVSVIDTQGVPMALIPAGEYQMGSQNNDDNERPLHVAYLDAFYIDMYEITNARYSACVSAGKCQPPTASNSAIRESYYGEPQFANYPVIYVSWEMAQVYCKWRDASLPSEAQWEKAARGGLHGMDYPWGNDQPICDKGAKNGANFGDCAEDDTEKVGSFSPNGYGLFDMAGNVWEWTLDWYSDIYYKSQLSFVNPIGPQSGEARVMRGGSLFNNSDSLRVANRGYFAPQSYYIIGFRCTTSSQR